MEKTEAQYSIEFYSLEKHLENFIKEYYELNHKHPLDKELLQ